MDIKLKEIRLRNFKSYKSVDIFLPDSGVLIGANNVGKTTMLRALQIAFDRMIRVTNDDIYTDDGENLTKDKRAIIDVLIEPKSQGGDAPIEFNDEWFEHFGDLRSEDSETLNQFIALRTIIKYNTIKGEYDIDRKALIQWPESMYAEDYNEYNRNRITGKLLEAIPVFYMDAKRDISSEMNDKYSYWGRLTKEIDITDDNIKILEESLNNINEEIINESPVLEHLSENLNKISQTVDTKDSQIIINPVSRKLRDLNRGMDITFKDQKSEGFPISNHGMGTRSWITFLTLVAYIEWKIKKMKEDGMAYHPLILLEEPEAHLHPQAQRKIFSQIQKIDGQKIISSHSPVIVAQANVKDIIHVSKTHGVSQVNYLNCETLSKSEMRKIQQSIFKSKGDILFADALILCEGETEEQALPIFFKEYFKNEYFEYGINIISVGGKGNYKPFLQVAKDFKINFYILSDGEVETIKKVNSDINVTFGIDTSECKNVKFLPNESDFEKYLLEAGYQKELVKSVEDLFGEEYIDKFIEKTNGKKAKKEKTNQTCDSCNQFIYQEILRDFSGNEGYNKALLECIKNNKTAYSNIIADIIIEEREGEDKIPNIVRELFIELDEDKEILRRGDMEDVLIN